ncbi:hypothetical protein [Flavobacterium sp. 245]|uniref:hypothetical protein n=1 Tax=Flavobacterium sp. 245 TaxID=2512115 RepID=UPI00105D0F0D|nr:hypothetical protein [Flavobacterium sp. 245]TDO98464.1 hypothetical protein EV145_10897 [Flavobacterium sp. 245]
MKLNCGYCFNSYFRSTDRLKQNKLNKNLKYFLSLFLVFAMIATDCTIDSQSKSVEYYQVSQVAFGKEFEIRNSRLYKFDQVVSFGKTRFSIVLNFLKTEYVFTFQINKLLKLQDLLRQKLTSFINQSVFINEIITSNNLYKSLYSA